MAVLFIPLLFDLRGLYEWARPDAVQASAVLQLKSFYLNVPFFIARAVIYFAIWILLAFLLALLVGSWPAASPRYMSVDEVRPGMTGIGRTVFEGDRVEEFKVHILGVLRNVAGPRRNMVLARLEGGPLANTGVIAGMSGSPVYIDGRLLGAVALNFPFFSVRVIGVLIVWSLLTGILTDPQFRVVMKALQQRDGTDLLMEASITTLSGRQTEIQGCGSLTLGMRTLCGPFCLIAVGKRITIGFMVDWLEDSYQRVIFTAISSIAQDCGVNPRLSTLKR